MILILPLLAGAQANVRPRITSQINEDRLMTLSGNTHPLARAQNDEGRVDPSLNLTRITMVFQPTAAQQADLDAFLAAQQNPTSQDFHQWLTPAQYGDRFGISQADMDAVAAWLQAHGLVVVETPPSRNFIVFNGTAAQVESAFHTEIHNYAASERKFYANSIEPSVPAALGGVVAGFRGLNNYPLKPRAIRNSSVQPNFTSSISGNHYVSPGDFATIYDLNFLYNRTPPIDGTGQKIVIVGQSQIVLSDIATFRSLSGLAANVPQVQLAAGTDPGVVDGDVQESSIDVEWAGAVAKNATIIFVYANSSNGGGVFGAMQYAITNNLAPVISISYGGCEASFQSSEIAGLVAMAQQANAQGITIVSAVGDGGATDCDGDFTNDPAVLGLNVDIPGSLPYVTGVGGTEFNEGSGSYWQPTSGTDIVSSALSYIPEKVWNDTTSSALSSGGGGASSIFGKPSWQTGTGVPNDGFRDVPDIALNASDAHDSYLVCSRLPGTNTPGCQNGFRISSSNTGLTVFGGTSFGGPTFAGILALVNQKTGSSGQGNVNYILYPLAANSPTAFHDITTGDNTSPCTLGSLNCPNGGSIGFTAGLGYDQATGLGSIDGTNLVNAWSNMSTGGGSMPVLTMISPISMPAGSGDFTLTATGSSFATNAQILWNGSPTGVTMLTGGTATSIKATISHTLVAYGTIASVVVNSNSPTAGVSSAAQTFTVNSTAPANDNIANAIAITTSNFTGTVDNSAATTELTDPTPPCALTAPAPSTNPRTKTVWWTLSQGTATNVTLSTVGSVYDTVLSVWTGAPGSLTNVACNDDILSGQITQSQLQFAATAGTKYFILVSSFGPPDTGLDLLGGKTVLNVTNANPSALSSSPSSRTVAAGSSATYTIANSSGLTYALACTGLPTGASCGPVSDPANSNASLVIATTSRSFIVIPQSSHPRPYVNLWPEASGALASLAMFLIVLRKRRTFGLLQAGCLALLLIFFAIGCGSGGGTSGGTTTNPNGTPAGTYVIIVTGTSGGTTQITSVTLIVT